MPSPILYTFRRCPYAIRTRMALKYSGINIELREIEFKNKPVQMLVASPKGTVPVLVLENNSVIDESMDIIYWALSIKGSEQWLINDSDKQDELNKLIRENDFIFKTQLDHYKYADRYPQRSAEYYRREGESFLQKLEAKLNHNKYLLKQTICLADIAIFPFIRQFALVDKNWFDHAPYPLLRKWLNFFLASDLFNSVMDKNKPWHTDS